MSILGKRSCLRIALIVLSGMMAYPCPSWTEMPHEYQIKGAFLYKFARYVEWPAEAFEGEEDPIVIGVLGEDPFGSTLDRMVQGKKALSRDLWVRRFARLENLEFCHILFISSSESRRLEQILKRLEGKSTLTVGEMELFCRDGGMIQLAVEGEMLKLKIRPDIAKKAGIRIKSKLLNLAQIVEAEE